MRITLVRITATIGLVLMASTACGDDSGSDDDGVASLSDDGGGSEGDATGSANSERAALEWARCMREEGVDVPDPETDEDGNVRMGRIEVGPGQEIEPEEFEAAQEVCGEPPGREMDLSPEEQAAMQDAALEFAQCMRDKGYDFPDPEFGEDGGVMFKRGAGDDELDPNDPQVQKDTNECQEVFDGLGPGDDS